MAQVWWWLPAVATVVTAAAGAVTWLVGRVLLHVGTRHRVEAFVMAYREAATPAVAAAMAAALFLVLSDQPELGERWRRAVVIAVIGTACWLIVAALAVVQHVVEGRLPLEVEDNRRIRRVRTQVILLKRVAVAVVGVVGLATALMTFPELRTFGASLLASAGIAGVIAGLAAQTTLGNVFAGLQLAFTDALRVDDVVVVEHEWGRIEDVTLTYVVVHIWDERRLVLPTSYFTTKPFENWTRTYSRVLGAVVLHLDYRAPVPALREKARAVIEASPLWDGRDWVVQVIDTTPTTMVVRVLASAYDASTSWDLQCDVREELLAWLLAEHPEALPVQRTLLDLPVRPGDGRDAAERLSGRGTPAGRDGSPPPRASRRPRP